MEISLQQVVVIVTVQVQGFGFSPEASLGRYFSFCAGLPKSRIPLKPMDWWAPRVMPTPRSCIPTISTNLAYCFRHSAQMKVVLNL